MIDCLADPDTRTHSDLEVAGTGAQLERRAVERKAVVHSGDAERLAHASRSRAQQSLAFHLAAPAHEREPMDRHERSYQDGAGGPLRLADEVDAPMHPVGTIDIGVTGWPEHHGVALGAPAKRVRRRVGVMIGLNLGDRAPDAIEKKR